MELGAYYSEELQYIALNIQSQRLCVIICMVNNKLTYMKCNSDESIFS